MSRLWIALAIVLWFGTYALAADQPNQVPQWFPPAVTAPAGSRPTATPMPAAVPPPRGLSAAPPAFVRFDAPSVAANSVGPARNHEPWHTQIYRLRNAPALQLAQALSTLFSAEQQAGQFDALSRAVIVPEVTSNSLIVAGPAEASAEIGKLIESLDRAAMMIRLEVAMGDVPTADLPAAEAGEKADAAKVRASVVGVEEARKKMEILFQGQLTTLDNQPASLKTGRREPRITGVNMSPANPAMAYGYASPSNSRPRPPAMEMNQSNMVAFENAGTLLTLTPRVNADCVVTMQLDFEDSRLGPAGEGVPIYVPSKGEPVRSPVVETLTVQTTIKVADGQTMLLCDMSRQAKNGKQRVILLTVHVLPIGDPAKHER